MKLASLISVIALAAWSTGDALAAGPDGGGSADAHNASTQHGSSPQGSPSGGQDDSTLRGDVDSPPPPPPPPPPPAERDSHSGVDSVGPDQPAADSAAAPPGREPTN